MEQEHIDLKHSFLATLEFKGKPLVMNFERLKKRLMNDRYTRHQRTQFELALRGGDLANPLVMADSEEDEAQTFYFECRDDRYVILVASGSAQGKCLSMEGPGRVLTPYTQDDMTKFQLHDGFKTFVYDRPEVDLFSTYLFTTSKKQRLLYVDWEQDAVWFTDDKSFSEENVIWDNKAEFAVRVLSSGHGHSIERLRPVPQTVRN